MITPIPIPAPIPMYTSVEIPRASPNHFSPTAARLTLLSTSTGRSKRPRITSSGSKPPSGVTL